MKEFIYFNQDLKMVTEDLNFIEGMMINQRQFILSNWILNQLKEKIIFSQNNLVMSSPGIQKLIAEKLEYTTNQENIQTIIDKDIKLALINSVVNYYHNLDFLKNFIVSINLDQTQINHILSSEKINNTMVNSMFIDITNEINREYCFRNSWNKKGLAVCRRSIDDDLWNVFQKVINTSFDFGGFTANSIKHIYLPTKYNLFDFEVSDYLDLNKKRFKVNFGNYDGLDIEIKITQEKLIEFNNCLVDFINQFLKKYKFI